MVFFEGWIFSPTLKKIDERFIQVTQRLLCRNAGHLIEPDVVVLFFEVGQLRRQVFVGETLVVVGVRVRFATETPIVHESYTAECTSKNMFLLVGRIESEFVGSFLCTHVLHFTTQRVKCTQ